MSAVETPAPAQPLASRAHTAGLVVIILALAAVARFLIGHRSPASITSFGPARIYSMGLAQEWLLLLYVVWGLRKPGVTTVRRIIDDSVLTLRRWALYAVIAVGTAIVWGACGYVLRPMVRLEQEELHQLLTFIHAFFPQCVMEKILWVVLSASAGFCEEFIYRGYLQQQFHRLTGSLPAAVLLQAPIYGLQHAALPWPLLIPITCLGLLLGVLAAWRTSLVPGMLFHAGSDIFPGLVFRG